MRPLPAATGMALLLALAGQPAVAGEPLQLLPPGMVGEGQTPTPPSPASSATPSLAAPALPRPEPFRAERQAELAAPNLPRARPQIDIAASRKVAAGRDIAAGPPSPADRPALTDEDSAGREAPADGAERPGKAVASSSPAGGSQAMNDLIASVLPASESAQGEAAEPAGETAQALGGAAGTEGSRRASSRPNAVRVIAGGISPHAGGDGKTLARPLRPREEERIAEARKLALARAFQKPTSSFFRAPDLAPAAPAARTEVFVPFYEPVPDAIMIEEAMTGSIALSGDKPEHAEGDEYQPLAMPTRPGSRTPRDLVQRLQRLQDEIAQGSTSAFAAQRSLLDEIGDALEAAPEETWQDPRNAEALVTYVLSGGNPNLLRTLLAKEPLPALDERLMRGALAYVKGRGEEARAFLRDIDPNRFAGSMGSQVAIAQAALALPEDPGRAARHLDMARLLAPGTLAEEAAIRREILVLAQMEDTERFQTLSRQYMQRFRHSVYAGNFRQRFAAALTRMSFMDDPKQFPRLDEILAEMEADARLELYLVIARALVVQAKSAPAKLAAMRVLDLAETGSVEEQQALLYRAAASVTVAEELEAGLADLRKVQLAALPQADRELFDVVDVTAELIRTAAEPQRAANALAAADGAAEGEIPSGEASASQAAVMARAQEAIKLADALLGEAR